MKVTELLKLYDAGRRDFSGENLRGQSFKGQDLSGANFSASDIRGTNFSGAILTNVDFTYARAGIENNTKIYRLLVLLLCLITLQFSAFCAGFSIVKIIDFSLSEYRFKIVVFPIWALAIICNVFFIVFINKGYRNLNEIGSRNQRDNKVLKIIQLFLFLGELLLIISTLMIALDSSLSEELSALSFYLIANGIAFAFGLAGFSAMHFLAVVIAICIPAFSLGTFIDDFSKLLSFGVFLFLLFSVIYIIFGVNFIKKEQKEFNYLRLLFVNFIASGGTSFRKAILDKVTFNFADLKYCDFRNASIEHTNFYRSFNLDLSRQENTRLSVFGNSILRKLLVKKYGKNISYKGLNLSGLNLDKAVLINADLSEADLTKATFEKADLSGANLSGTQAVNANFKDARLTGACIENWNIDVTTILEGIEADYVFLKSEKKERRPRSGKFKSGDFATLVQQVVDTVRTVDLIFEDGINWQVFFQSFHNVCSQHPGEDFTIQAIEKKRNNAFVVRLEVSQKTDKALVERQFKELYETKLTLLEQRYRAELQAKDGEIVAYREQSANLMKITEMLATRTPMSEGNNYDLRGAQFGGGYVAGNVEGNQYGGIINNTAAETPSLAEVAAEIQDLLKQLEASNPSVTEADQTAFLNVMILPTRRERFIGALKAAGEAAIEEVPYGSVLKALVEGWQRTNG